MLVFYVVSGMITDNNIGLLLFIDREFSVYNFVTEWAAGLQRGNFAAVPILSVEILYFSGIILTNVKIFRFPHSTCRIIGQHALYGKENLIVSEYNLLSE